MRDNTTIAVNILSVDPRTGPILAIAAVAIQHRRRCAEFAAHVDLPSVLYRHDKTIQQQIQHMNTLRAPVSGSPMVLKLFAQYCKAHTTDIEYSPYGRPRMTARLMHWFQSNHLDHLASRATDLGIDLPVQTHDALDLRQVVLWESRRFSRQGPTTLQAAVEELGGVTSQRIGPEGAVADTAALALLLLQA